MEKSKTVLATASLVKEFVEMDPCPHDRPLSERRVQVYRRILADGHFRPVVWASALCKETGNTYRVNGKHTSFMLGSQEKLPEFWVILERYICDTLADVAKLYGTFDSSLASRTTADINMSFARTIPDLADVNSKIINLAVAACGNVQWTEAEIRRVPPAERAELLIERSDFVLWLKKIVVSAASSRFATSKHILREPVVRAMCMTYDRSDTRKAATEFWTAVREESAPDKDDPTRVLARYLVRATMSNRTGGKQVHIASAREVFVKCLHAWNAWRKGEPTSLAYYAGADLPKIER